MSDKLRKCCKALRNVVRNPQISIVMEAHNGLSAKIVEQAGFPAIWASGLSISTALGVRDSNELAWAQLLDVMEYMVDAADIPVLFDGDTGHGNFNTARLLVKKLEQRGVAGIVIEDKLFPKMNSFVGDRHPLAAIEEFQGKIRAMKDAQTCDDFVVVARVEALISGHGMSEALRRAEAYRNAGADAIFIHSRKNNPDEIFEFATQFSRQAPLVVAPTTYSGTPFSKLEAMGITTCICANQNMRASLKAMADMCRSIRASESINGVESLIAPLSDVFALIDYDELEAANIRYLPSF